MQVLGERSNSGGTDPGTTTDPETSARKLPTWDTLRPGRRRGARVRGRSFVRPKRARRRAAAAAALALPDPLLTVPMAIADPPSSGQPRLPEAGMAETAMAEAEMAEAGMDEARIT